MKPEGSAVVYCEGAFSSTYGKTAHGLVRFTERYRVVAVIDSTCAGKDSGTVLENRPNGIPVVESLSAASRLVPDSSHPLTHFVVGLATDGGYVTAELRAAAREALDAGLNVDSGLHDFLGDDVLLSDLAASRNLKIRDIRRAPADANHMFTGRISDVGALRVALLGTDSAVGKRTTAWKLTHGLQGRGFSAEFIGTGQTAWLQGAEFSIVLDSLINDYVSGELENVVLRAWDARRMDFAIIEGQGSLMNPGYPGGFEILAACRPDCIIMQHAPARIEYDGFTGYPVDALEDQIFLAEFLSKKKVIAVTVNDENIPPESIDEECAKLRERIGLPVVAPLHHSIDPVLTRLEELRRIK